jgi:CMP/dCMP kinase
MRYAARWRRFAPGARETGASGSPVPERRTAPGSAQCAAQNDITGSGGKSVPSSAVVIAIDGPAGAGKSTVARAAARALGFTYLDTGAMYRAVGLAALRGHPDPATARIAFDGGRITLDDEDVSAAIRTPEATDRASRVAVDPAVRRAMVARQRELMRQGDWVAEGRDIGTVVVPHAELKVFLTADPRERAQRRAAELGADPEEVLRDVLERDERDTGRADSPLVRAADAREVDTTGRPVEEVIAEIVALAEGARR